MTDPAIHTPPLRLVVFDWDGTLMDSEARIVACLRATGEDLGLPARTDAALRDVIGLGLREAIASLHPDAGTAAQRDFADRYRQHFLAAEGRPSTLFRGALELVSGLHRRGLLLAIATGKGRRGLDRALAEQGCAHLFHASRCADETFSKPHPRMLVEIMEELEVTAVETLMVGDTEYDLQMAHNAGVAAAAVSHGVHARHRLLQHGPLICAADLAELTAWLQRYIMERRRPDSSPSTAVIHDAQPQETSL
jgi:phosphoglycolate phosphatase